MPQSANANPVRRLHDPDFHAALVLRVVDDALHFLQIGFVLRRHGNRNDFHERPQVKQIDALRPRDIDKALPVVLLPGAERVGIVQRPSIQVNAPDAMLGLLRRSSWAIEVGRLTFAVNHRHKGRKPGIRTVRVRPRNDHNLAAASIERTDDRAFIAQVARRCQVGIQGPGHLFPNGDNRL